VSGRVAILVPDPADEAWQTRWAEVLERNGEPLRRAGIDVAARSWADSDDLAGFDLVLPLLVWGYPHAHGKWLKRVDQWEAGGVRLRNPAPVLRWNSDKAYLARLADRGAPVVPTQFVDGISVEALEEAAARFGTERLVAKPRISSTAWQTIRWSPGAPLAGGPQGAAIIQPYLPEIERTGETSLIYFAGRFSHAIAKLPRSGDFRVQPEYESLITRCDAAEDELAAAEAVLAAVEEELLYARVDLVRGPDGRPVLIELELIEPDLYLEFSGDGAAFAKAVAEQIGR
jgi:glutathione synthase/RimK-type ligase-like ATP-grasp enzyme